MTRIRPACTPNLATEKSTTVTTEMERMQWSRTHTPAADDRVGVFNCISATVGGVVWSWQSLCFWCF